MDAFVDKGFSQDKLQTINSMSSEITQREAEVVAIAKSIEELAGLFKDLSFLVIEQVSLFRVFLFETYAHYCSIRALFLTALTTIASKLYTTPKPLCNNCAKAQIRRKKREAKCACFCFVC